MKTSTGINGTIELYDDHLLIRRDQGMLAKATGFGTMNIPLAALSGVSLRPATRLVNGHLQVQIGDVPLSKHLSNDPNTVTFTHKHAGEFDELADLLREEIAANQESGVDSSTIDVDRGVSRVDRAKAKAAESQAKYAERQAKYAERKEMRKSVLDPRMHTLDDLGPAKLIRLVRNNLSADDVVVAVVQGVSAQALIALEDRLLVAKAGILAGSTGGGRVTVFRYRDILGIQVNTGITQGTIVIQTAGVSTSSGDYWAVHSLGNAGQGDDPFKLPNAIPTTKQLLKTYGPDLDFIRERVRCAGEALASSMAAGTSSESDLADELAKLAALHESGALSAEEFAAAKLRILKV